MKCRSFGDERKGKAVSMLVTDFPRYVISHGRNIDDCMRSRLRKNPNGVAPKFVATPHDSGRRSEHHWRCDERS
jgi:hypothetical protein